ncbi:MAG: type VI secretion protein IcmF/TssM N-terminal domain-containing protein, partial [Pseudomonadota bacterium]
MMRFINQKKTVNSEKYKLNRLKKQSQLAVKMLLQLHKQHQTTHCVLVIGQPESGKSILCASSGTLIYATQDECAFEIYLQSNTLFFHIPHNFFLISEIQYSLSSWQFLALQLKKQRTYLPITRCLITIDLHDVLTRSNISNDTRLSQVAFALNTLANQLKAHLEVTLFFTKADLIPGFDEFFNHESKEFLEQPWGLSLDTLNTEFDDLIKKLNERLLWRLHHEIHTEQLHLIKIFPLALESIKHKFLEILPGFLIQWNNNRFLNPAQLYFVSCRQFRELTESTQAESSMIKKNYHHYHQTHHKHFFTQQALESQCEYFPESNAAYIDKITKISFIGLCSLLLLAFVFYTSEQFSKHIALVQSANQTLETSIIFSEQSHPTLTLNSVTTELEKISIAWENLEKNHQSLLIGQYIFTRDSQLETQLQNIYQRIISQQWLPLVNQRLEDYIHDHLSSNPANAYIAFTIYLMLSQPDWPIDTQYIDAHLTDLLGSSNDPIQLLPGNIQKNLLVIDENSPFIQNTRDTFLNLPPEKLAYILLFATLDTRHSLNLTNAVANKQPSLKLDKKFSFI